MLTETEKGAIVEAAKMCEGSLRISDKCQTEIGKTGFKASAENWSACAFSIIRYAKNEGRI